jgi:hypothetical protein
MVSSLLVKTVDDELRWREAEMALAKIYLHRSIGDLPTFRFTYRCFVAMSHAHFEGYIKKVLAQALLDIATSGTPQSGCNSILRLALFAPLVRKKIQVMSNIELLNSVLLGQDYLNTIPFPSPEDLFDVSNMNFKTFSWAVSCVGLDPTVFDEYLTSVNHLAKAGHECAHGEMINFDQTKRDSDIAVTMFQIQATIIKLMHHLAVQLIDHFEKRQYCA